MPDAVEASSAAQAPDITGQNPFQLIAYVLFKVRHSLEDEEEKGRPPRWVRIARARNTQGDTDFIGKGVKVAINGFAETLAYMHELTLDLREILVQADAAKALTVVTADLLEAATSTAFQDGVRRLVGEPAGGDALGGMSAAMRDVKGYVDYIPEPDDVKGLGNELYRLMCIEQLAFCVKPDKTVDVDKINTTPQTHVNEQLSGKIRLMQWAFGNGTTLYGLDDEFDGGGNVTPIEIFRIGARRLWQTADNNNLPKTTRMTWTGNEQETVAEFSFDDQAQEGNQNLNTLDLVEVHNILLRLGYGAIINDQPSDDEKAKFTVKLSNMLRCFQKINRLSVNGLLDNATLNQLMHFDYQNKNVRRAKPYDSSYVLEDLFEANLILVNRDANGWKEEALGLKNEPFGYAYYPAGVAYNIAKDNQRLKTHPGWINDSEKPGTGFVAMQSRVIRKSGGQYRFDGGDISEGESHSPFMFYAAYHSEPWLAGRSGTPKGKQANANPLKPGDVHRLYQWIDLTDLMPGDGYVLSLIASASMRSLWVDRSIQTGVSDQGRIAIELYSRDLSGGESKFGARRTTEHLTDKDKINVGEAFKGTDRAHSAWFPQNKNSMPDLSNSTNREAERKRKRHWTRRNSDWIVVPKEKKWALVILEGKHQSAWDTDAYFDNVEVKYRIKKDSAN
ncbi:hypothetical protein ACFL2V_00070 [Pseudomonadota bacterium]